MGTDRQDNTEAQGYFDPANLGKSLSEVSSEVISTESHEITSRWFHSEKDADLFIWQDQEKNIIKQQLSFFGQIVEWNIVEGTKTGVVFEDDNADTSKMEKSDLIRFDNQPLNASVHQAISLLDHVEKLNDFDKNSLIKNFKEAPRIDKIDPNEFVLKYGRLGKKAQSKDFWQKLWSDFRRFFRV